MGTKSTRSSGTQHNPKGVTQGVTLVDPKSGNPIDTVLDSDGIKRLAVDANFTAQNVQANVELDYTEDSVALGDPNTGTILKINTDGSIDSNIEVDAGDGDNIGLKVQERNLSPSDTKYSKRVTAVTGTGTDANSTSLDVSLHDGSGNTYTSLNPLPINSVQILKQLQVPTDFFGNTSVATRTNQIEVPLDDTNWTNYIDAINVSTGAASQANGQVTLTTGTNTNGRYAIISKDFIKYRPNSEIGWGFTWCFPTPSINNVAVRIGATDDATTWANSVYFSHENGVFSLVHRNNGALIFSVPQSLWLDKCDGSVGSSYIDFNGNPVALNITRDQLARIRAGLFGHAGFVVEIIAPNQQWVTIYKYSNINTASAPVFANFDLKIAAEVKKVGAGSGVYTLSSACWAGWTGSILTRMDAPLSDRSLAQVTRTVIEGKSSSGGGTYVPVKVNPSGALETSIGDISGVAGQDTMTNSLPVTIASDQSPIPFYLDPTSLNEIGFKKEYVDPFNRLISAQPVQIGSMDHRIGKHQDYWDEAVSGSGTAVHNANTVSVDLKTTTANGDSVTRQTYRQFEYKRGNSQSIYISGNLGAIKANTVKQLGYYDDKNGAFFETNSTEFRVVRRTSTSGVTQDFAVSQANFNVDKVDGAGGTTNPSGISLNLSLQQLFGIEFSWLGTNIIDFFVVINGRKIILHRMSNSNLLTTPWSQSGQLPIRGFIQNTGITSSASQVSITCCAIFSNGSSNDVKQIRAISSANTALTVSTTEKVIAGIRLKPGLRNIGAEPITYDLLPLTGTGILYYKVVWRPTLVGATWADYSEAVQTLTNNPTYSGGIIMDQGHATLQVSGRTRINIQALSDCILGYSINNTPDSLVIVAVTDTGSGSLHFDGTFREIV